MPRVYVDGCFDLGHFGHGNLIRQAQELAGEDGKVIVGVHSDEEITLNKRRPIFNQHERFQMLSALKWGDEIVPDAPYSTTVETIRSNSCDFCIHGSDITTTAQGDDSYKAVKEAGLYVEVPRTQGVSTTQLIKRVLTKKSDTDTISPYTGSKFMLSSKMMSKFQITVDQKCDDVIIYVPGCWDLFHPGHVDFLRAARARGDYLIVGIYDDATVQRLKGPHFPIMNVLERAMTLLGCKYVNEVIIGAPYSITDELMNYFDVAMVVYGQHPVEPDDNGEDPFLVPAAAGKLSKINSFNSLTTEDVVERIQKRQEELQKSSKEKEIKENEILQKIVSAQ